MALIQGIEQGSSFHPSSGELPPAEESAVPPQVAQAVDVFLKDGLLEFPEDFQEPPPYHLGAREWEIYSKRRARLEQRIKDATTGTNFG